MTLANQTNKGCHRQEKSPIKKSWNRNTSNRKTQNDSSSGNIEKQMNLTTEVTIHTIEDEYTHKTNDTNQDYMCETSAIIPKKMPDITTPQIDESSQQKTTSEMPETMVP